MSRTRAALVSSLFLALAVTTAIWIARREEDPLARLRHSGVIRIGYAVEPPYAFIGRDGGVTGESPEIAKVVAAQLGLPRIEWRLVQFEELLPELEAGRIDVVAAGMFITPERQQRVAFSRPTFRVLQGLLVAAGNPHRLHSFADAVARTEVKVAVLAGSVEAPLLRLLGLPFERRFPVPDAQTGRAAVESGLAAGFASSAPSVRWMARNAPAGRLEAAQPFTQTSVDGTSAIGTGAFAFRKSDHRLCAAWDSVLADYLGSPAHQALVAGLDFTPAELPGHNAQLPLPPR